MICPFCGHSETKVVDSRDAFDGKAIRRRRECEKCQARFSTYEEMEIMKLTVVKRDGSKQEYARGKIEAGIRKAIGDIEYEIQAKESSEITSKEIGKIILEKLKEIDDVGYLRFASVYKSFKTADSFRKEMEKMET